MRLHKLLDDDLVIFYYVHQNHKFKAFRDCLNLEQNCTIFIHYKEVDAKLRPLY